MAQIDERIGIIDKLYDLARGMLGRSDVDDLLGKLALSDRQTRIFEMFYVQKKDIWMISNEIGVCEAVVNRELKKVRTKIAKAMGF